MAGQTPDGAGSVKLVANSAYSGTFFAKWNLFIERSALRVLAIIE